MSRQATRQKFQETILQEISLSGRQNGASSMLCLTMRISCFHIHILPTGLANREVELMKEMCNTKEIVLRETWTTTNGKKITYWVAVNHSLTLSIESLIFGLDFSAMNAQNECCQISHISVSPQQNRNKQKAKNKKVWDAYREMTLKINKNLIDHMLICKTFFTQLSTKFVFTLWWGWKFNKLSTRKTHNMFGLLGFL